MTQEERRIYLIRELQREMRQYENLAIPDTGDKQWRLLRSLFNVRPPYPASKDFLKVQDEFLEEEAREKGIVTLSEIPTIQEEYHSFHPHADKISVWKGDITRLAADAIVNAANSQMLGCFIPCHRCIDNAIHSAAGIELREECNCRMNQKRVRFGRRYEEPTGQAMLTKGYNLPAEYVIHTVGPIVGYRLNRKLEHDLKNCYESVLKCCLEHNIRSVAFCCISTGEFHFPNDEAAKIAVKTVSDFLDQHAENFDCSCFSMTA